MPERRSYSASLPSEVLDQIGAIRSEFKNRILAAEKPRIEDYVERLPQSLRDHVFRELLAIEIELLVASQSTIDANEFHQRFPDDAELIDEEISRATRQETADDAEMPTSVGPYKLLQEIGSGGMGTV